LIAFDKANTKDSNRYRRSSIWVDGVEYKILTSFPYWIAFEKKIKNLQAFDVFDEYYIGGKISKPKNKEEGFYQLLEFYREPFNTELPRDMGDNLNIKVIDWLIDSEYINAAFISQYNINLITTDIHFHDFIYLSRCLKGHAINDIMTYRSWVQPKDYKDPKLKQKAIDEHDRKNRDRWKLEEETKELFNMR